MGHKVHPIGLRLGIHRKWKSNWFFESKNYPKFIHLNLNIERFFRGFLYFRGIKTLLLNCQLIKLPSNQIFIFIFHYRFRKKRKKNFYKWRLRKWQQNLENIFLKKKNQPFKIDLNKRFTLYYKAKHEKVYLKKFLELNNKKNIDFFKLPQNFLIKNYKNFENTQNIYLNNIKDILSLYKELKTHFQNIKVIFKLKKKKKFLYLYLKKIQLKLIILKCTLIQLKKIFIKKTLNFQIYKWLVIKYKFFKNYNLTQLKNNLKKLSRWHNLEFFQKFIKFFYWVIRKNNLIFKLLGKKLNFIKLEDLKEKLILNRKYILKKIFKLKKKLKLKKISEKKKFLISKKIFKLKENLDLLKEYELNYKFVLQNNLKLKKILKLKKEIKLIKIWNFEKNLNLKKKLNFNKNLKIKNNLKVNKNSKLNKNLKLNKNSKLNKNLKLNKIIKSKINLRVKKIIKLEKSLKLKNKLKVYKYLEKLIDAKLKKCLDLDTKLKFQNQYKSNPNLKTHMNLLLDKCEEIYDSLKLKEKFNWTKNIKLNLIYNIEKNLYLKRFKLKKKIKNKLATKKNYYNTIGNLKRFLTKITNCKINLIFINALSFTKFFYMIGYIDKKDNTKKREKFNVLQIQKNMINRYKYSAIFIKDFVHLAFISALLKNTQTLVKFMGEQFKRLPKNRKQFRLLKFLQQSLKIFCRQRKEFIGFKLQIKGRLNRRNRTHKWTFNQGILPTQTHTTRIEYGYSEGLTRSGLIGIKLWFFYKKNFKNTLKTKLIQYLYYSKYKRYLNKLLVKKVVKNFNNKFNRNLGNKFNKNFNNKFNRKPNNKIIINKVKKPLLRNKFMKKPNILNYLDKILRKTLLKKKPKPTLKKNISNNHIKKKSYFRSNKNFIKNKFNPYIKNNLEKIVINNTVNKDKNNLQKKKIENVEKTIWPKQSYKYYKTNHIHIKPNLPENIYITDNDLKKKDTSPKSKNNINNNSQKSNIHSKSKKPVNTHVKTQSTKISKK